MNLNLDKKNIVLVFMAVMIVAIVAIVIFAVGRKQNPQPDGTSAGQSSARDQGFVTREASPENVVVPDSDSQNLPENVAKPNIVAPGSPTNDSSYRSFDIKAANDEFTPNTIIVNEGDTMNINVEAVDKDYDFTQPDMGFKTIIKKGNTEKIQVTFPVGTSAKFAFYCALCGGPEKGPVGHIIVAKK